MGPVWPQSTTQSHEDLEVWPIRCRVWQPVHFLSVLLISTCCLHILSSNTYFAFLPASFDGVCFCRSEKSPSSGSAEAFCVSHVVQRGHLGAAASTSCPCPRAENQKVQSRSHRFCPLNMPALAVAI